MDKRYSVLIQDNGETFACDGRDNLLRAMEALGRRGIPVGCRGGGCGVCKVRVTAGDFETRKMSRACISEDEERAGVVLACRVFPASDLALQVVGKLNKAMCAPRR
ncbi:2Fe-2S iron-sulfur cluster binding domain-containing protein [Azoarcus olearius]|uniref:Probable ferredoxin-like protein n=1 Tax=Azoarcus sp. (strain BH72) TaxID=418699 RepID=A1K8A7_AZOSB|nr:2Fe-2S iron-sulfur cluster binding domain-containing protein [Azoarcus olearius]ANQ85619.1 ferredoxin-like protein [Azoarcus olearius]CAL95062.1 probable ferredoxin-like protein [Azoarcus olearius]